MGILGGGEGFQLHWLVWGTYVVSGVLDVWRAKKRREACMNPRFRNGGKNLLCTLTGDKGTKGCVGLG